MALRKLPSPRPVALLTPAALLRHQRLRAPPGDARYVLLQRLIRQPGALGSRARIAHPFVAWHTICSFPGRGTGTPK